LQIGVKPDAFNATLVPGDLVRVRLDRIASTGASSAHDFLYELDRIGKSVSGDVRLELTHFPVDTNNASIVAQEVNAAVGGGVLLPTGLTGITCDINSSSDTSVPADTSLDPSAWDTPEDDAFDFGISDLDPDSVGGGGFGGGFGGAQINNPSDDLGGQVGSSGSSSALTSDGDIDNPQVGDTLTAPEICEGGVVTFYRVDPTVPGGKVIAAQATSTYTMIVNDVDKSVYAEVSCPDPTSPTGYGEPIQIGPTPVIAPAGPPTAANITGTIPPPGNTTGATLILTNSGGVLVRQIIACESDVFQSISLPGGTGDFENVTGISVVTSESTCPGLLGQTILTLTIVGGTVTEVPLTIFYTYGIISDSQEWTMSWAGPGAVPYEP
jgi:hypothetical protein